MTKIFIDGQEAQACDWENVIQVARRYGLTTIPSLCYHPALKTEASCRMCVVEVEGLKTVLTTACTLKVKDGLRVRTDTEAVRISRKETLSLLLKRSPDSLLLQEWAREYNLDVPGKTEVATDENLDCILCGLCVRVCALLGLEALQFIDKGKNRRVKLIIGEGNSPCIGCRACEWLCSLQGVHSRNPSGLQEVEIWRSSLPEAFCASCGQAYATQAAVTFVKVKVPASKARINLCPQCKRIASIPHRFRM